ncbi:MFS transporter, partial [Saccharomonospora iraqiensis]|uniref:MFS transporter n=1 Tax=Saccharomonospora iraqiensis TaxID=52698 RepID=UPI00022E196B
MRGSLGASGFYGWHIVGFSALMVATTAPGQTAAVSVFIDPMLADLGISRSAISTAYLVGTLTGAVAMPFVGRALDRFGVRRVMAVIGAVFALALCALSAVSSIVGLTAGFVAIRMAGQGALGLAATTAVALWFDRRRGTAMGLVNAVGVSLISLAPVLLESLIAQTGWRRAWLIEGLVVAALVLPVALLGMRDRPADLGQRPDGRITDAASPPRPAWGLTRAVALRTPFFWTVTGGIAATGMLSTAINFHQIDLLTAHGLSTVEAAANFVPQTVANLVSTLGVGMLADRLRSRVLVALAMAFLGGALLLGTSVTPGLSAVALGVLLGAANGSIRAIEAATFPRHFGTTHIGAIRGVVTGVSVGSTAFGPVLFAVVYEATASYTPALLGALPLPLLVIVAAVFVRPPEVPAPGGRADAAGVGPAADTVALADG